MSIEEAWATLKEEIEHGLGGVGFLIHGPDIMPAVDAYALAPLQDLFAGYACSLEDESCECDLHAAVRPIVRRIQELGG